MDEQNGECSDHPDDLYSSVNPLDFLLESQDSSRNVPCSNLSSDIDTSDLLSNLDAKLLPPNNFPVHSGFSNCIDPVNSSKISAISESDLGNNCSDFFNDSLTEHSSNLKDHLKLDLICGLGESDSNKDFLPCSLTSTDGLDQNRAADNISVESEITRQSDAATVQTYFNDNSQSTNYTEVNLVGIENKIVSPDSECNSQDTQDEEESDEKARNVGNGHYSAIQSGSRTKSGSTRGRKRKSGDDVMSKGRGGCSVKKRQPAVTYHSQISPDQNGIKLKIKKSPGSVAVQKNVKRKERTRKRRSKKDEEEEEENLDSSDPGSTEQSKWGSHLPVPVLIKVFSTVAQEEGCLPFLVRASSVCRLWREAALAPSLWNIIDLTGTWVRDRYKSEAQLAWLCENRFSLVEDLNIGGWKFSDKQRFLQVMTEHCPNLRGITLTGWTGLHGDHLKYLVDNCQFLSRIDLTSICPDGSINRSAVSMTAIRNMCQTIGDRLTHLTLADNKITGISQIVTAIAENCPNLEVFDISNMCSYSTAPLPIERFQNGCQKLRVLRFSNSNLCLAQTSLKEQVASLGFPCLEELSVASIFGLDGSMQRPTIDDNSLERILKNSHKLRLLDVRGCSRISDSSLVRVPAWDLEHLFLSGCYVTKMQESGLELIVQKWSHSLIEMDLGWCTATAPLDSAVTAFSEKGEESPLRILNLCGSSVSLEPVKAVLLRCPHLQSLNLSSCRALPRGMKRLYEGFEVVELRKSLLEKPVAANSSSASASPSDTAAEEAAMDQSGIISENTAHPQEQSEATLTVETSSPV
ncbi:Uncharacterized protein GBIM_15685, partial [Gryllus bimaculatus]